MTHRYAARHRDGRTVRGRTLDWLCVAILAAWGIEADADNLAAQLEDGDEACIVEDGGDFADNVLVTVNDREPRTS